MSLFAIWLFAPDEFENEIIQEWSGFGPTGFRSDEARNNSALHLKKAQWKRLTDLMDRLVDRLPDLTVKDCEEEIRGLPPLTKGDVQELVNHIWSVGDNEHQPLEDVLHRCLDETEANVDDITKVCRELCSSLYTSLSRSLQHLGPHQSSVSTKSISWERCRDQLAETLCGPGIDFDSEAHCKITAVLKGLHNSLIEYQLRNVNSSATSQIDPWHNNDYNDRGGAKRGRGRPSKRTAQDAALPKRGRGRPRKVAATAGAKRPRGRPRKVVAEASGSQSQTLNRDR